MPNELRRIQNFVGGLINNADILGDGSTGLTAAGTTLSSPALASITGGVTSAEHMAVVLDPDGLFGAPEIAHITALSAGGSAATIARGQEGTAARDHPRDVPWVQAVTSVDFQKIPTPLLHVRDEKPTGTNGGGMTSGSWVTRTLNTVRTNEIVGASLAANQVTLPAGVYEADGIAPGLAVAFFTTRLYDTTAAAVLIAGAAAYSPASTGMVTSRTRGRFTLTSTSALELQMRSTVSKAGDGMGVASTVGDPEVYADLMIRKVS